MPGSMRRFDVHLFLMSLAPAMRQLPLDRHSWLKVRMQERLQEAEFGWSFIFTAATCQLT